MSFTNLVEWLVVSPEPFHKDIIQCPTAPVHADSDSFFQQHASKRFAGELMKLLAIPLSNQKTVAKWLVMATLIGVEYLRCAVIL